MARSAASIRAKFSVLRQQSDGRGLRVCGCGLGHEERLRPLIIGSPDGGVRTRTVCHPYERFSLQD
jgi:hypothetical protein